MRKAVECKKYLSTQPVGHEQLPNPVYVVDDENGEVLACLGHGIVATIPLALNFLFTMSNHSK